LILIKFETNQQQQQQQSVHSTKQTTSRKMFCISALARMLMFNLSHHCMSWGKTGINKHIQGDN